MRTHRREGVGKQRMQEQADLSVVASRRSGALESGGEWLPLADAAVRLGVSIDTMRRRIKRHEVEARTVKSPKGPAWRVWVGRDALPATSEPAQAGADEERPRDDAAPASSEAPGAVIDAKTTAGHPETTEGKPLSGPSMAPPRLDLPAVLTPPRQPDAPIGSGDAAVELVRLVSRLQEENRFLAGQVGFLQAQLDQAHEPPAGTAGANGTQAPALLGERGVSADSAGGAETDQSVPPGHVVVDAGELAELRRARDTYEAETERLAEEMARVQELLAELEAEHGGADDGVASLPVSAELASPLAPTAPVDPQTTDAESRKRTWWKLW